MHSPSGPSTVIDQSHPQSAKPHGNPLLGNVAEPDSEEDEDEEYAAQLYLPVTHGKIFKQPIFKEAISFVFVGLSKWKLN